MNGQSMNTEAEERRFNFFKTVTKMTSNHHLQQVILNCILCLQVKENVYKKKKVSPQESKISKLNKRIKEDIDCSFFWFNYIEYNPWEYQSHIERIADFLLEESDVWTETADGIKFNENNNFSKQLHHFRTYTISEELDYVKECWK